jgi:hypothetical protein
MPDPDLTPRPAPIRDWNEAFAALPLETPDAGTWQRVQRAGRQRRASRWPLWLSMAAMLALAAVLPWQLSRTVGGDAPDAAAATPGGDIGRPAAESGIVAAPAPRDTTRHAPAPAAAQVTAQGKEHTLAAVGIAARQAAAVRGARPARAAGADAGAVAAQRAPVATDAAAATPAAGDAVPLMAAHSGAQPAVGAQSAADAQLEALYAESARLEALLALARDDRVATGAAAALGHAFDAQVANIDAALREPALPDDTRNALWQQRVDTLRQFAGFESTQRALAASGERYDAMLVSVD